MSADLVRELKTLRKGRGLHASRFTERVGPGLRAACAVTDGDGLVVTRQKVAARLTELAERLPADLREVTLAAFAIGAAEPLPLYQDRVEAAAAKVERDPRTVRRRVDEAIVQLAELARSAPVVRAGADGWHTTDQQVVVVLDRDRPEVLERRRIMADHDGLTSLNLAVSVPAGRRDVEASVYFGGTLVDRGMEATERVGWALNLPKPLALGEFHEFVVRFRLPFIRPYLMSVPRHPCDLFDLRVRFGRARTPRRVWTLHGAFQRDVSDPAYHGNQHPVDDAGEIHLRFQHLRPGLAYGARWEGEPGA